MAIMTVYARNYTNTDVPFDVQGLQGSILISQHGRLSHVDAFDFEFVLLYFDTWGNYDTWRSATESENFVAFACEVDALELSDNGTVLTGSWLQSHVIASPNNTHEQSITEALITTYRTWLDDKAPDHAQESEEILIACQHNLLTRYQSSRVNWHIAKYPLQPVTISVDVSRHPLSAATLAYLQAEYPIAFATIVSSGQEYIRNVNDAEARQLFYDVWLAYLWSVIGA